ncbi:TetR/AcrR family transcriptional regulator [Catenulispora rubra]|uniref:TetR/AcrR family transcriptional regulator n=1 Tax=Catenulispora rubra TaxID=280293 RepID=UPI002B26C438|nr:TetR/AcrR family transcriptional regulator [Catenulispora rubra]
MSTATSTATTATTKGRPRGFDRDQALEAALMEFWRHGYEATSISTLTKAMGINPPSLYAAFGDKRKLFSAAVQRYAETHGDYGTRAMGQPTARGVVETMLRLAATEYTATDHPPGCLVIDAATNTSDASQDVAEELRGYREDTKQAIAERIAADVQAGALPPTTDAPALATFYAAVIQGMSTQARDGASEADLQRVADVALAAWPA